LVKPPPLTSRRDLLLWTKRTLFSLGIKPKKKLSQSFVVEPQLIIEIMRYIQHYKPLTILEIGAGLGTLTYHIASLCKKVIAIEIDGRLAFFVKKLTRDLGNVEVITADILEIDDVFFNNVIVGNIPYHITSDIILRISKSKCPLAIITLQREFAERLVAKASEHRYGKITIITDYLFEKKICSVYPPIAFYPTPSVYSALITMKRIRDYDDIAKSLEKLLLCTFTERNKLAYKVVNKCTNIDISGELPWLREKRVDQLTLNEFLEILHIMLKIRK